jgi:hypothetical protein
MGRSLQTGIRRREIKGEVASRAKPAKPRRVPIDGKAKANQTK